MNATRSPESIDILLVDDSEGTRFVFSNWLRRAGYVVHEASTGAEAMELLGRHRIDCALLDVHLPDMSGFDLCDFIKKGRTTSWIPVLHVSATATGPDDRIAGLTRGADGYLVEPVERDELLATVTALLRYHDAQRSSERLAARLERLHESTLLINAASDVAELIELASMGISEIYRTGALVVTTRGFRGRYSIAEINTVGVKTGVISAEDANAIIQSVEIGPIDLSPLAQLLPEKAGNEAPYGATIRTPFGQVVGAIVLLTNSSDPEDSLILDHLAQTMAVALENQRLLNVEHQIALTLQRAMLPSEIPFVPGLDIAVRYQAASDTVEIGGDFYDVLVEKDGKILIAIGDVLGHSLQAASIMAELRYSLRALSAVGLRPAAIVEQLGTLLNDPDPARSATLCLIEIDLDSSELLITNAGHPPPLVSNAEGLEFITEHGPLLGLMETGKFATKSVPFGPGSLVVMTTDGLIERRHESITTGLGRMEVVVNGFDGSLELLCDALLEQVGAGEEAVDDIAIVVARRPQ